MKKISIILLSILLTACGKEFLNIRQVKNQVVPQTISDFQAILDIDFFDNSAHSLGTNGADEYRTTETKWEGLASVYNSNLRDIYIWNTAGVYGVGGTGETVVFDWTYAYYYIFCANQALQGIETIKPAQAEHAAWNNVKGSALFFRAYRYYQLAQQFCPPYGPEHKDSPYGLPLRTSPEVNQLVPRSSVQKTYDLIIQDLKEAVNLLPVQTINPQNHVRPSKAAPLALLAKVYLVMGDYEQAREYADEALVLRGELRDFNTLVLNDPAKRAENTFEYDRGVSNPEVIYFTAMPRLAANALYGINLTMELDPFILSQYSDDDLRKKAYFKAYSNTNDKLVFRGSYGAHFYFSGLAVDELYLIRAECNARLNQTDAALQDMNLLLKNRMLAGSFTPLTESDPEALLRLILMERRKELFFRGVRWEDLRRLNQDPRFAVTLVREVGGNRYELPPNDRRYTWPLPPSEIDAGGVEQYPIP